MEFDLILYYCREECYRMMRVLSKSAMQKFPNNPAFHLQYCISLVLEANLSDALKEFEVLTNVNDVSLASILAMIFIQNQSEIPDGEMLMDLESRFKMERKRANEMALYYSASFYLQLKHYDKAQEYNEAMFRLNRNSAKAFLIKGWLELYNKRLTKAEDCFKNVLIQDNKCLDAALGQIMTQSKEDALLTLNQLVVKYADLVVPLIEKVKFQLANRELDQILDTVSRIMTLDPDSFIAMQYKIIHRICVNGDYNAAITDLEYFVKSIKEREPNGWQIMSRFSALLCRICGCNVSIVKEAIKMMETAVSLDPRNASLLSELGYQYLLIDNLSSATVSYKKAAKLDNTAVDALIGLTKCNIRENGLTNVVKQQIEFLFEIHNNLEPSAELLLLQADCNPDMPTAKLIDKAVETKFKLAEAYPFGVDYLIALNSNFILEAVQKYPDLSENKDYKLSIIKRLITDIPGLINARLAQARIEIEIRNYKHAELTLKHILENMDKTNMDANLMLARLLIHQEDYEEADSNLELCLSQNLNVRSKPLFHFLSGIIQKHRKNYSDCVNSMKYALDNSSDADRLTKSDLATLYLEMSASYRNLNKIDEATEAIAEATKLLKGSGLEDRVILAQADLAMYRHEPNVALELLNSIPKNNTTYYEARIQMADIYLLHNNDKKKFVDCYEELANTNPSQENLVKLAEAFFSIRDINKAVETYERAIKQKYSWKLSCKLAELYVKVHQYGKAIRCYREAGAEGSVPLAELLLRLDQPDVAVSSLNNIPLAEKALVLSKVKEKGGDMTEALGILKDAYEKVNRSNSPLAIEICRQMARYETNIRDYESAVRHYKLALSHCGSVPEQMTAIQVALSKLYLQMNDWNSCKAICSTLLSRDPNNEVGMFLLADIIFKKGDFQSASDSFERLLKDRPAYWLALARLIEIKKRTGSLEEANSYIDAASEVAYNEPGLNFCLGLYNWYSYKVNEAMKFFNFVKHDSEWGQQAIRNMIEICIASEGHEALAQSLLQEIRPSSTEEEINRRLLTNFVLLSGKDKSAVDKAMSEFTLLAARDILRVGASLGLAMGYMLQKQHQRARNVLKIVSKTVWQYEEAEYLERCWIMLADHYIQSNKYELSIDLLKRILTYNQSCYKALEFYGILCERDQKFGEASGYFQKAWIYSDQSDPDLAFRLATTLLKAKCYVETIIICQDVLKKDPNNFRIKREIYDKALTLLRT